MLPLDFPNFPPFPEPRTAPLPQTKDHFWSDIPYPPYPSHSRRHTFPELSTALAIPLPRQTDEEIRVINHSHALPLEVEHVHFTGYSRPTTSTAADTYDHFADFRRFKRAMATAREEVDITDIPMSPALMTDMEVEEAMKGEGIGAFGAEPLQVAGGVALVEESVENHVADVITQQY